MKEQIKKIFMLVLAMTMIVVTISNAAADESTKALVELKSDYAEVYEFDGSRAVVLDKEGKYGFIDTTGKEILPCSYQELFMADGNLWAQDTTGKYVVFNFNGKKIKDVGNFFYVQMMSMSPQGYLAGITNNAVVVLDKNGKVILKKKNYTYISQISKNLFVGTDNKDRSYRLNKKGKVKKKLGKSVSVEVLAGGYVAVSDTKENKSTGKLETTSTLLNKKGKKKLTSKRYMIIEISCNGKRITAYDHKKDKFCLLSLKGKKVTTFSKSDTFELTNGLFTVGRQGSPKLKIVNAKNKTIIKKGTYKYIYPMTNSKNLLSQDKKGNWYLVSLKGKKQVSYGKYESVRDMGSDYLYCENGNVGQLKKISDGTTVFSNIEKSSAVIKGKVFIKKAGKWGIYQLNN